MHLRILTLLMAALCSLNAKAALTWTDAGDPYGTGLRVVLVYPEFASKSIVFKCADGRFFRYWWDPTKPEMTENAKAVYALLLTALVSEKKVSIAYESESGTYLAVDRINLHE